MARLHRRLGCRRLRSGRPRRRALRARRRAFARLTDAPADYQDALYLDTEPARRVANEVAVSEQVRPRDHDGLEAQLVALDSYKFKRPRTGRRDQPVRARRARGSRCSMRTRRWSRGSRTFKCDADADLAARLRDELVDGHRRLRGGQGPGRGARLPRSAGARRAILVRDCADVRAAFQQRFTHLFVDEFQDTDPLQAEILLLLAARRSGRDALARGAPGAGQAVRRRRSRSSRSIASAAPTSASTKRCASSCGAHGAACVALRSSFRAVPDIQRAVNAAFAPRMTGDAGRGAGRYVPLAPVRPAQHGQPAIVALPVPRVRCWNGNADQGVGRPKGSRTRSPRSSTGW